MSPVLADRPGRQRADGGGDAVDPRIAERRDAVLAERRRRRSRRALAVAVAVTVGCAAWGVTRSSVLDVDHVVVHGAGRTAEDEVVAASGLAMGDPMTSIDPGAVAAATEALPWVAEATVRRRWLEGTVEITLTERAPAALVVDGEQRMVVDATGRVLAVVPAAAPVGPGEGLVTVDGVAPAPPGATLEPAGEGALAVATAITPALATRVERVSAVADGVEVALRPAGRVRLGRAEDVDEKLATLTTVLAEVQLDCIATIDIRVPDTASLTREPSCA